MIIKNEVHKSFRISLMRCHDDYHKLRFDFDLVSITSIDPEVLLNEHGESLKLEHWTLIANKVAEKVWSGGYQGIVISHGTDTHGRCS